LLPSVPTIVIVVVTVAILVIGTVLWFTGKKEESNTGTELTKADELRLSRRTFTPNYPIIVIMAPIPAGKPQRRRRKKTERGHGSHG
jgi:flagellar basal body-associated protein FliL